ncbi:MAG: hypothetical protein EB127_01035 [Alphaproteobacteria bacterium]|nr:hypothetical protein [Alphaproteobacteria bacterium]
MSELELADHFDRMNKVVEELLKGNNPSQISKNLAISRADVIKHIDEWRSIIHTDNSIRTRAKEAIAGADQHYAMIISKAWETVEQADANSQYGTKAQALKLIADVEAKRLDMLNKAGVLENSDLGNQLIDNERKQQILIDILKQVSSKCDNCKREVAQRLSDITGRVEPIDV